MQAKRAKKNWQIDISYQTMHNNCLKTPVLFAYKVELDFEEKTP